MQRLLESLQFAAEKHSEHRRKNVGATPYINHPIDVALCLSRCGITDEAILIAAVLHDTVEDTETSFEEIQTLFGPRVCSLVRDMTDDKDLPKMERKQFQVDHASQLCDASKQIKIADKICNLQSVIEDPPKGWDEARRLDYLEWARAVFQGAKGVNTELDALFMQTYERGLLQILSCDSR